MERKRDRALYQRLIESYHADRVGLFVDFDRLNHPKSPVWSPWENVAPVLIVLSGAMVVMFAVNLLLGTALMVAGIFAYLLAIGRGSRSAFTAARSMPPPTISATGTSCGSWAAWW